MKNFLFFLIFTLHFSGILFLLKMDKFEISGKEILIIFASGMLNLFIIKKIFERKTNPKEKKINSDEVHSLIVLQKEKKTEITSEMEEYRREYIGNISHEMKTPLFLIQNYLEAIEQGELDEKTKKVYLNRVGISTQRLLNIVKDLDTINQFESGQIRLDKNDFDLNILTKEVAELMEMKAKERNAKISIFSPKKPIMVRADREKIGQILINLVQNSIDYCNRDLAQIDIRIHSLNEKILVEVEDNGVGISKEALPRIFERFYRVELSRNKNKGGSGLGLSIVKHIIEAHQQTIWVESEYLKWIKFSFTLDKTQKNQP